MKAEKRFLTVLALFWGALIALSLLLPPRAFSELENRYLASIPSFNVQKLVDGSYMRAWETYMSDHFALRDAFVRLKCALEILSGKTENNEVLIGRGRLFPMVDAPDEAMLARNTAGILAFAQSSGVPSAVLLVPSAAMIYADELPANAPVTDELAAILAAYGALGGGVFPIDASGALLENSGGDVYYKTDHHWTTYGAYLAYVEAAKALSLPVREWKDFCVQTVSDSFQGTLHSESGIPFYAKDAIEAAANAGGATLSYLNEDGNWAAQGGLYFPEWLAKKDQYSYFLGTMQAAAKIETGAGTGRRLVLFKDSYAHCFAPFLLYDYDEILLVDLRYAGMGTLQALELARYDDALFLFSFDEFSHELGAGKLSALFSQG